jgi:AmpE protein
MAITLIAVVIALVVGHTAQGLAASVRHYDWFGRFIDWLNAQFPEPGPWRGPWGIAIALVPVLLAVALFQVALREPMYGLAGLLFAITVLFYAWGPRDLDLDVEAVVQSSDATARRDAMARLVPQPPGTGEPMQTPDAATLVSAVFHQALRRWFGVLFWFLVLGPVGALGYRLAALSCEGPDASRLPAATAHGARVLLRVLDWPVAQLMTLALALVGNFDTVLTAWREQGGATFELGHRFLYAAGRASVRTELAEEMADDLDLATEASAQGPRVVTAPGMPELRDAMSLVWRMLLVWLAVLALFVIAGFVA